MSGWIKMHRAISTHWIWDFDEPDKAMAWVDLLLMARHSDGKMKIKGKLVDIRRGEIGMSQLALQKRWKWSQNKVKRFLNSLKNESMIDYRANELTTIISICNFDSYQDDERADERTNERADGRPHGRTGERRYKNGKNDKNGDIVGAPDGDQPKHSENPAPKPSPKGSRLPDDWELDHTHIEAAREIKPNWDDQRIKFEADKFRDHWHAKTGKDATKRNWLAAWRNWLRNARDERPSPRGSPAGGSAVSANNQRVLEEWLSSGELN